MSDGESSNDATPEVVSDQSQEATMGKDTEKADAYAVDNKQSGESVESAENRKKQEEDDKNTCCCIFLNFPKLGVWGVIWTFLWPIFALVVMIMFAVSFNDNSTMNCFKPVFLAAGLDPVFKLLLALFSIAIIVTFILYFYDLYLFSCFSKEQPEIYVKAREGKSWWPADMDPGRDLEMMKKHDDHESDNNREREGMLCVDLPTKPVGCFGKMIAYCEWKYFRVKKVPGVSFYHVQGASEILVSDILALSIVVSVSVGLSFINVTGILVMAKSVASILRHLVTDVLCTNCNTCKKLLTCCDLATKCKNCAKKCCKTDCLKCDCLKKCSCDCLKKCKCDCLKCDSCKKDIDCKHFKLRCRNCSYSYTKRKVSEFKKENMSAKKVRECVTASPACSLLSIALLISTSLLAACCAIHSVGLESWTLGGGVSNLQLHPSFPFLKGLNHLQLNLTYVNGAPVTTSLDFSCPMSLIPFEGESSCPISSTVSGMDLSCTKKLFRTGSKAYLQLDCTCMGSMSTLFQSEISTNPLACVASGLPCQLPVTSVAPVSCGSSFNGTVYDYISIDLLHVCSLV